MNILLFGATGLIGQSLLEDCLQDDMVNTVKVFVRKSLNRTHPKLQEVICDYTTLALQQHQLTGDVVFNCLGTTLKVAGSKEAQYTIDCLYPVKVAALSAGNDVKYMISVSSIGASASGNFYLRTKYDMEEGIKTHFGSQACFMRPSLLTGPRKEFRLGEKVAQYAFYVINLLLWGPLKNYRSIKAATVARAMLNAAKQKPAKQVMFYEDMVV